MGLRSRTEGRRVTDQAPSSRRGRGPPRSIRPRSRLFFMLLLFSTALLGATSRLVHAGAAASAAICEARPSASCLSCAWIYAPCLAVKIFRIASRRRSSRRGVGGCSSRARRRPCLGLITRAPSRGVTLRSQLPRRSLHSDRAKSYAPVCSARALESLKPLTA